MHVLTKRHPGKRAFITGAASGLGKAIGTELAKDGWHLTLADISGHLEDAAAELQQAGAQTTCVKLDVTDEAAYTEVVKQTEAELGGMDLVFNNAGVAATGDVGEATLDDWRWVLDINLRGVLYGCHLWGPILQAQGHGHIANTASMAALMPVPGMGAYCVSKAAVRTLTDVLWGEISSAGVDVSVIMPEFFQTNLADTMRGDVHAARTKLDSSGRSASDVARYALKQMGKRKVHIVYPPSMEVMWWVKRTLPSRILPMVRRMVQAEKAKIDATRPAEADPAPNPVSRS